MNNGNLAYKDDVPAYSRQTSTGRGRTVSKRAAVRNGKRRNEMYLSAGYQRYNRGTAAVAPRRSMVQSKIKIEENRVQMLHRKKTLTRIIYILIIAAAASFMITKFVAVHETKAQITKLEAQLDTMRANTSQKIFEMEQSVDLGNLEQEATNRLGMQRPEKYQMIYVDVKQDDVTEVTAGEVEGLKNNISSFFAKIKKNIVEAFSIK